MCNAPTRTSKWRRRPDLRSSYVDALQQVDEREHVAELLGAATVGMPGAVHDVAIAQEHIHREPFLITEQE
jgi:hypothetical protein